MQGGFCAEKPYMDGSGASLPRVPESIQARIKRLFLPAAIILQAQGKVNRRMGSKHGNTREGRRYGVLWHWYGYMNRNWKACEPRTM